jgi:hypothetical protein
MPNTTNRGYFYPSGTEAPNGPYALQTLADAVDADVEDIDTRLTDLTVAMPTAVQAGSGTIAIGAGVPSATLAVTFPTAFSAAPVVVANLTANVAGRASLLKLYPISITATGFTAKMQTSDNNDVGTSYTLGFNWVAVAP